MATGWRCRRSTRSSRRCAATARSASASSSCRAAPLQAGMLQVRARVAPLGRRPRAGARRGRHRGAPGRRGPARLRRERQPRAEDAGRRALAAGRGGEDAADDPEAVRRFAGRMQAEAPRLTELVNELIDLSRLQGDEPLDDAEPGRRRRASSREAVDRARLRRGARDRARRRRGGARLGARATAASWSPRCATCSTTRSPTAPRRTRGRGRPRVAATGGLVEITRHRPGHRHPRADEQERIFERFYRVDPARVADDRRHRPRPVHRQARRREPRRRGHGLERAGRGLDVHLPPAGRPRRRSRRSADRSSPPASHRAEPRRLTVTRVLVVEDEESFRDALSYMLRKEGFEVAVAATGPGRARRSSTARGADLVLLDLMLPGPARHRGLPRSCGSGRRAGHHGHGQGRRDRQGGRARARRRRLRHQAVLARASCVARIRAVLRRGGEADELLPGDARGRARADGRRAARRGGRRRRGARCRSRSSSCSSCCCATPAGCSPAAS